VVAKKEEEEEEMHLSSFLGISTNQEQFPVLSYYFMGHQ
jgi:hypothetical protein